MKPLANDELLALDSPWTCQPGVVRVLGRQGENPADAFAMRPGRDGMMRPYIFDTSAERRLHFSQESTQSAMSLLDPDALVAPYTRKMMSFLLLNPNPRHIVMVGLGGGSLAKFCFRHLPKTRITVVEIDADVIALREQFLIPPDDARFRVVHDDGARYLDVMEDDVDVVLVDAFDADGIANSLAGADFCRSLAPRLGERGVLVMNLCGRAERYVPIMKQATATFGANAVVVAVSGEANLLLFASRRPPPTSITSDLETVADQLRQILDLDFPRYLRRLCQGYSLAL